MEKLQELETTRFNGNPPIILRDTIVLAHLKTDEETLATVNIGGLFLATHS